MNFAQFLTEGYAIANRAATIKTADIGMLLDFQADLMGLLPRSAEALAEAEYQLNRKKGELANDETFYGLSPSKAKLMLEGMAANEERVYRLTERLNRTVTHLLDTLSVRIATERRLMPYKE